MMTWRGLHKRLNLDNMRLMREHGASSMGLTFRLDYIAMLASFVVLAGIVFGAF